MNKILFLLLFAGLFSQNIYHDPIESINYCNSIEIDIFTDLQGSTISSYTLFYKKNNQTSFFRTELKTDDGIYYSAVIPQEFINTDDIYYFIELITESNSITIPNIEPKNNHIKIEIVENNHNFNQLEEFSLINGFNIISPLPNTIENSRDLVISSSYYELHKLDIESIKIFINDIDFTSQANIKEKYFILSPKNLKSGLYNVNIIMSNKSGEYYNPIKWSFKISEDEGSKNFKYSGKIFHNYFNNNIEDDILSYHISNILFKGSAEWIDFEIKIKETTLENVKEQPKNRYNVFLRASKCLSRENMVPSSGFFFNLLDIFLRRASIPCPETTDIL